MTMVKICGIRTEPALDAAIEAGADYVGLVHFAKSPRHLEIPAAVALAHRAREHGKAKVVVHKAEAEFIKGLAPSDMLKSDNGDKFDVGGIEIELMHTPGHTPGSQCFLVDGRVVSGDTMFIDACCRVDFPGGNPEQMYYSLTQKLAALPEGTAEATKAVLRRGLDVSFLEARDVERAGLADRVRALRARAKARAARSDAAS